MLDNWGKGNDELRALNIQFKIKDQKSYVKKKGRRRRRGVPRKFRLHGGDTLPEVGTSYHNATCRVEAVAPYFQII